MKHLALKDCPPYERPGVWRHRPDLTQGIKCDPIEIVVGYNTDHLAIEAVHDTVAGSTKLTELLAIASKTG
jgi:hypothetical protein